MEEERKVVILNIDDILPNRFQPRIQFNEQAINELAESIKLHGVIQPIVVRKISDKYEIIAGERRYKASVMAGKTTIPAIVTDLDDKNSAEVALIENVQRQDLTPIEEAISYKKILDMGYINQEELGSKLGKKQSTIANKLRLLNLSDEVQEALMENKISERHARSLLKLNEQDQILMLNRIINERLTVRKTDEEIAKLLENNGGNQKEIEKGEIMNNDILRDFNIPTEPIINDEVNSVKDNEVKPQEIQESINPSYNFTNEIVDSTNQNNNQVNPGFMDIDKIEKMAEDINKPEVKLPNVDLMFNPAPVSPV
ncbi:MAG: ParB/RepB/Spo0J family partition protein, partial [Bacilli bacterium]|nr:ParB/RepB/Spo0J family partition protein [Bacilli bacterium]